MPWAQCQVKWAKVAQKPSTYDVTQKICNPQPKNFFRVQTRRLAWSFEPLNSSLPLLVAPELHACKATCDPVVLAWEFLKPAGRQNVEFEFNLARKLREVISFESSN